MTSFNLKKKMKKISLHQEQHTFTIKCQIRYFISFYNPQMLSPDKVQAIFGTLTRERGSWKLIFFYHLRIT